MLSTVSWKSTRWTSASPADQGDKRRPRGLGLSPANDTNNKDVVAHSFLPTSIAVASTFALLSPLRDETLCYLQQKKYRLTVYNLRSAVRACR